MVLSPAERKNGRLSKNKLSLALRALSEVGYVVIEGVIPGDLIHEIKQVCNRTLHRYLKKEENRQHCTDNRAGHVGMSAPCKMPFMDGQIIENSFAMQILHEAMDGDFFCTFYNTNTAWPGSGVQRIHRDTKQLFPGFPFSLPIHMVVVNISLVDFTIENGATEVWPSSHLICDVQNESIINAERAQTLPSTRTVMRAGSVVVRDMRMWHRGMPNRTDTIRTMLALVYFRGFLNRDSHLTIPRSSWDQMTEQSKHLFRFNKIGR